MKKLTKAGVALGAIAAALVVPTMPTTSAQESTPTGYTLSVTDGGCELMLIDLATGGLVDLPAGPSEAACAVDLAASPGGVVYGVSGDGGVPASVPQAVDVATLITYSADGAPTVTPINVADADGGGMIYGGIAVSPAGTVYVQLVADEAGCDTGAPPDTTPDTLGNEPEYAGDSVCLYTLDPATGVATLVGTTGLFETPFYGLASCGGLTTIAAEGEVGVYWASQSATTGLATPGPAVTEVPVGYDCNSTVGSPLWALTSPDASGPISPLATEVTISQVDPATGETTAIVAVGDATADLMALAVVPDAAPLPAVAVAEEVAPAFTG
jgi:hypothetical protein